MRADKGPSPRPAQDLRGEVVVSTAKPSGPVAPVMPTYNRADVAFERGEGVYLYAEGGRRYLDFA